MNESRKDGAAGTTNRQFFDKMSDFARWRERRGETREAQAIRDRRNKLWDRRACADVRYQQVRDESRSDWR